MDSTTTGTPARLLLAARQGNEQALGELLEHFRNYLELLARLEIDIVASHLSLRSTSTLVVRRAWSYSRE